MQVVELRYHGDVTRAKWAQGGGLLGGEAGEEIRGHIWKNLVG